MSKDFFYDEATSKIFNRTHVEMRNLYFLFKKWPRENQQGFVKHRYIYSWINRRRVYIGHDRGDLQLPRFRKRHAQPHRSIVWDQTILNRALNVFTCIWSLLKA